MSSFHISRTRTVGHPRRPRLVCTGVTGRPDLTVLPLAGVARLGGGAPSFFRGVCGGVLTLDLLYMEFFVVQEQGR
jgi:hypothetical protein